MSDEAQWHWAEGMKYAVEAVKTLLTINGAAAVSILTFIGNTKASSNWLIISMIAFALGAGSAGFTLLSAYITQLYYGNSYRANNREQTWELAQRWHKVAYFSTCIGFALFIAGIGTSALALWEQ